MNRRTVTQLLNQTRAAPGAPVLTGSKPARVHRIEGGVRGQFGASGMRMLFLGLVSGAFLAAGVPASSAEAVWKDGMMYTQEEVASLQGHKAVKIVFGLEPGKCTGELTAVSEWLKMTQGRMVQTYPGKGDVERVAGDEWFQENGTKVSLCNKTGANAILTGVQFKRD